MKLRVSKIFTFETAHALWGYDGKCKNIHGHSYVLTVTVTGDIIQDPDNTKHGMIIDFGDLKAIVNKNVVDEYDHFLLVNGNTPHKKYAEVENGHAKIRLCDFQPSCENMLIDIVDRIRTNLPEGIDLKYAKLQETATAYTEWFLEDNQ
ncbi:MAG: 6-carboxytetrahydropterin synthase [Crocinitomicaceae bacterium]|nr:6-carboxytetrahydropterin synthase [Crocinitomicaceae bacterium]